MFATNQFRQIMYEMNTFTSKIVPLPVIHSIGNGINQTKESFEADTERNGKPVSQEGK